jgi:diadenosine tetraphosphate (Ap4A) HIT family hydrolase
MTLQHDHLADFAGKFRLDDLHLADCGGWRLSLRPGQLTLGSLVLSLRSGATDLAALSPEEGRDMAAGFGLAETLLRETYGAVRLNLLCLMMQDPVVHFHILPRYDRSIERHGAIWTDADWPGPPTIRPVQTDEPVLQAILAELRAGRIADIS